MEPDAVGKVAVGMTGPVVNGGGGGGLTFLGLPQHAAKWNR
jgi:hypothetical protein